MSEWMPEMVTHAYWGKKGKFLYDTDTYLTWVLFAVEDGRFEYQIGNEYGEAVFGDIVVCPPYVAFYRNTLSPISFHAITFTFTNDKNQSLSNLLPEHKITVQQTKRLSENYHHLRVADQVMHYNLNNQRLKQHYFLDLWLMIIQQNMQHLEMNPLPSCGKRLHSNARTRT
ncbi:hypothetical protein PAECIP111891_03680 [Paenibacillus allorhizoplanae]|uniref:AraC family transcriptional regulator n=1 Tax=Paenibacillus allorhizoplanae TaxID=2905648 RepID=A0ABM9CG02_9BACL|nr:hypothetical protein [Paenibacillus allorhizoplanae]CAH1211084.1 hypothetical protein PAECIP111891_03680 [Paenibacillus allorhizoplanae]